LKRNLFKIDVRAQKDEEKVFMRTACVDVSGIKSFWFICDIMKEHIEIFGTLLKGKGYLYD
ncbi:hypothetical protein, partial [Streptococcus agalactiae]|uniref:hypothetical protein n=2 Tax=Streptococcus agalactiae TaxID=1311 RepID=UPI0029C5A3E5